MAALYVTDDVRHRLVDGLVVLLDIRAGEYVILDSVGTAMWQALLTSDSPQERISRLEQEFDAPADRLEQHLTAFAQTCVERGFLLYDVSLRREPSHHLKIRRSALALRAWQSLFSTTQALAKLGFARTYQAYARFAKPPIDDAELDTLVSRAERAFLRAENCFIMRAAPKDCLPRSLALYRFLLSAGVPSEHVIGVQRYPFQAHAWVECRGRVLCDTRDYTSCFSELARI